MAIKCGIVGLPNVGKSTLFNALTAAEIPAENYPFCTIDPNVGIVPVPDPRLDVISDIVHPQKTIPTTMEFVDIAGLVEGASKGEGLGNKFLGNIRETHAIAHVVRCFENDDITHISGTIDPIGDIETINTELGLADLESPSPAPVGDLRLLGRRGGRAGFERKLDAAAHEGVLRLAVRRSLAPGVGDDVDAQPRRRVGPTLEREADA